MKPKLLNFLTVLLLTLIVLSPALVVVKVVWQQHLGFTATQHLLYGVKNSLILKNIFVVDKASLEFSIDKLGK